jgi:hypothetical protein
MAGVVVSANGVGGVTINIPIQFSVFAVNTRIITDGFTTADVANAIQIPDALVDVCSQTAALQAAQGVSSMVGNIMPTAAQAWDKATGAWSTVSGDPMSLLDASTDALNNSLQPLITVATSSANATMIKSMRQLIDIGSATDIAGIQAACAAHPHPNPHLGGVQQGAQQMSKFWETAKQMKSSMSELGSAVSSAKSISKNVNMISAMATLAGGIASKCGLPEPPSIEAAFETISDGTIGNAINTINAGMSAVSSLCNQPYYSGLLDDAQDLIWQKTTLGTTGIVGDGSGVFIPPPTWQNPNPHLGTTTGSFPAGKSLGEAFEQAKEDIVANVETCKQQIQSALAPMEDLGNAACGAANAFNLSMTALPNISPDLEALYQQAHEEWNEMSQAERAAAQEAAFQRRQEAEANRP